MLLPDYIGFYSFKGFNKGFVPYFFFVSLTKDIENPPKMQTIPLIKIPLTPI